jgi:GNAT superfamily N-acetyltransferase
MDSRFEIARYRNAHKEQVLCLQQHLWGRDAALNRAYFEWKYESNPYLPDPAICLALHRGEVVGMRGIVGARWRFAASGATRPIPFTDDFVIAPEHRNQTLASSLIHATFGYAAELGYPFLLSLRAGHITLLASLAAGYRSIGAMKPVSRIGGHPAPMHRVSQRLRGTRFLWRFAGSALLRTPSDRRPFRHLDRSTKGPGPRRDSHVSVGRTPLPEAMAGLAERLPQDNRIQHVRDREFFDWVFRNPRLDYRFLYWTGERLEGYLVLHRELPPRPGPVSVWVSDWEGTDDAICQELLETAVSGRFARIATWTATFPESSKALLDRCGFEPTDLEARARGRPAALIRPVRDDELDREWTLDGRALMDLGNWKLRLLDQD